MALGGCLFYSVKNSLFLPFPFQGVGLLESRVACLNDYATLICWVAGLLFDLNCSSCNLVSVEVVEFCRPLIAFTQLLISRFGKS